VIKFGDSYEAPGDVATTGLASDGTGKKKGRTVTLTTDDMQKRKNDTKKNLLKQQYGNFKAEGSKTLEQTFNRLQVIISQLQFIDVEIEQDDLNQKFLTSLALEWLMHTIVWRNRSDLNTMSLDDLYNHLKVYESEVQKKSEPNSLNMAFISSAKHSSGNEEVNIASGSTASINVSTASANIEDINQIDEDDIEEMDIKWNMALLSMRADRAPRSQDKGRRDNYRQGSKVEEQAPKTLMAIDGVGWDWIYMANDKENHALITDEETPTEFSLMAKTCAKSEVFDNTLCSKAWLALAEHRNQELKYCEKIRVLEFKTNSRANCIESLTKDLEVLKKEKGYSVVPPLPAQVYSPPKKDMSWTGLPKFKDDTVTDYSRPAPTVESSPDDAQNKNPSVTATEASPSIISPEPFIKFVKANDSLTKSKTDKVKTAKKPPVKYAEQYRKPTKKTNGSSQNNIDDKGYWNSGCSRHMTDECMLWHRRLGHLNFKTMNRLVRHNLVRGLPSKCFENNHTCTACLKGKQHKASCKSKLVNSVTKPQHTLHMDLFGPTFDETSGILRKFITEIENLKDLKVKIIRCDNGGEFINKEMNDFCSQKGIKREFSNARTPQQNGVAERRNRTLIEAARTMVFVNKSQNKTSYELFNGTKDAASQEVKKDVSSLRYIALPNLVHDALLESSSSKPQDDCSTDVPESSGNSNPTATSTNPSADQIETLAVETPIITVNSIVLTACFTDSQEPSSDTRLISKRVVNQVETPSLDNILTLTNRFEDILGVTINSVDLDGVEADVSNMETTITISPTPTLRIHKDQPKSQIFDALENPSWVELCREFEALMHEKFQMSAMSELNFFLGLQVLQKEDGNFLSQDKYVGDILKKFRYSDVRSSNTPMDKENPWGKDETRKD
nr:hypothetical protein [Tanacetum cinerariifolium]